MSWVYLLGIPLGWQVYLLHRITCSFAVCYPRDIHVPKRYGPPEIQSKTYTQEVYPRHIYLLGDRYTSWVYILGCIHMSWMTYSFIPLGYTSWVAAYLLGCMGVCWCGLVWPDSAVFNHDSLLVFCALFSTINQISLQTIPLILSLSLAQVLCSTSSIAIQLQSGAGVFWIVTATTLQNGSLLHQIL